jgi:hypothetical protein
MVLSRGHVDLGHTGRMHRSEARHVDSAALRVRVGIALWLVSWIPFGVIFRVNGWAFLVAIAVEIIVGLIGLALAGSEVARSAACRVAARIALRLGALQVRPQAKVGRRDLSDHASPPAA